MGYQALLFCPDERTARTVTQVLSELDFSVIPCTEPFAAVKKLMGEHFDAVVVDCDNEQNATLLFKSARHAPNNHSSLAVAVVEGQAGVAKAFRIGANLVLTKPVNVEQAKGTLRVARGLLRKSEAAKPATGAASAAVKPAATPSNLTPQRTISVTSTSGAAANAPLAAASIPASEPAQPRVVASVPEEVIDTDADLFEDGNEDIASPASVAPELPR
jgi:DNA-binding response OmpR family regulator